MPLSTATISARVLGTFTQAVGGLVGNVSVPIDGSYSVTLAEGTGSSQADRVWQSQRTLSASTSEDLDLAAVLTDTFGATITFVKVKAIYVKAAIGNTNTVVVGNATSNQFVGPFGAAAHTVSIAPGGVWLITAPVAGWTVTAGTGDLLKVLNGGAGTPVTYDICVIGTSA